jgi:hypothetical protein
LKYDVGDYENANLGAQFKGCYSADGILFPLAVTLAEHGATRYGARRSPRLFLISG